MKQPAILTLLMLTTMVAACSGNVPAATPAPATQFAPTVAAVTAIPATALPTLVPLSNDQPLRLQTADGATLAARQWGAGADWVILSSNGDGKSERWQPLAEALHKQGYVVLTYDWRGTTPALPGKAEWILALNDAKAALAHARAQGARRMVLAGGSLGGITSIKLGNEKEVVGVLAMGAPYKATPLDINVAELKAIMAPKLFMTSAKDSVVAASEVQWLYDNSLAPKSIHQYSGDAHGVELLASPDREDVIQRTLAFVALAMSSPARSSSTTGQPWREDVQALAAAIRNIHPKAFFKGNEAEWMRMIETLAGRLDTLSENEIKAGLMRIAAQFDGHTRIYFGQTAMNWRLYGVRLYAFRDGVFVIGGHGAASKLVGAKLLRVGGVTVNEALTRLRPYVEHDNESWVQYLAPTYFMIPELLLAEGLITDMTKPNFVFLRADGVEVTVQPEILDIATFRTWMPLFALPARPETLWLGRKNERFWLTCLADCTVLYVQYNAVQSSNGSESLSAFVDRAQAQLASKPIRRVIVDLRHNGGGDNTTYGPMLSWLQSADVNQAGKLFVLTGRNTFSAAANFVTDVERSTKAMIVGEPMGGSPNLYGDTRTAVLPNSRIEVWVSARYWQKSTPDDVRLSIQPARMVLLSSADWFAGRDPVLDAALR